MRQTQSSTMEPKPPLDLSNMDPSKLESARQLITRVKRCNVDDVVEPLRRSTADELCVIACKQ